MLRETSAARTTAASTSAGQMRPDRARNPVFDLWGGNSDDRSGVLPASRERRPGHIVSPAPPALGRMARTHAVDERSMAAARRAWPATAGDVLRCPQIGRRFRCRIQLLTPRRGAFGYGVPSLRV